MAEPRKRQPEADVIVVLGSKLSLDGGPTPSLKRRVAQAVRLFSKGRAENLLLSGGVHDHPTPEAEVMAAMARDAGIGAENIVIEARSLNTLENAALSAAEMEKRGWRRAIIVTDSFHLPRALFTFRRFGVEVTGSAAPGVRADMSVKRIVVAWAREAVALPVYAVRFLSGRAKRVVGREQGR